MNGTSPARTRGYEGTARLNDGMLISVAISTLYDEFFCQYQRYGVLDELPDFVDTFGANTSAILELAAERWHPKQKSRKLPDGSLEMERPYLDPTELTMDILRHSDQVRVISPPHSKRPC